MTYAHTQSPPFEALADPMRRRIVERLAVAAAPVGVLAETLPVSRPAVSQHLKVLRKAGLVAVSAEGTKRIYRLDPRGIAAMRSWLDQQWGHALAAFKDVADQEDAGP